MNSNLKDSEPIKKEKTRRTHDMAKLLIVYDSQTGNTEKMAEAVAEFKLLLGFLV